ncbi:hypothetical protein [Rhizobium tumorigenes]|uniref:hypothetical protein n=1 Tax=Rhizobium tumorigenes TaxID=2041385 RepID=UPI00241DDC12|nr:hypothetical protein [Rhizobium tumorigenes]WFS02768.1 hypothetical protein PR016_09275 [Rhizobium tumorigenes]
MFIKNKATVLLGVAAAACVAGGQLVVNTQGIYNCSPSWATTVATFDHSSNSPPGNKGWVDNGLISLKGL